MKFDEHGWELFEGAMTEEAQEASEALPRVAEMFCNRYLADLDHESLSFDEKIVAVAERSPKLLFELNGRFGNLACIKRISSSLKACGIFSRVTGVDQRLSYTQGNCSFLINPPSSKRLQYSWHTARQAYPKRSCFLNFWMPLVTSKTASNGTLQVPNSSHKYLFPAVEGKHIARDGSKAALTQYAVPECFVEMFEVEPVIADVGDVAVMHPLLLHSSSTNTTANPSYTLIFKIWSDISDFALSSKLDVKLYEESNEELFRPTNVDLNFSMTRNSIRLY